MIAKASRLQSQTHPRFIIPPAVVLQAGLRPLRVAAGGRGRRLGPLDPMGRLQPDVRRRRVLLQPTLRQPQVSPQALLPGEAGGPCPLFPLPHFSPVRPRFQADHRGQVLPGRETEAPLLQHRGESPRTSIRVTEAPLTRGKKGISQFPTSSDRVATIFFGTCSCHPLLSQPSPHLSCVPAPSSSHVCSRCVSHLEIIAWP